MHIEKKLPANILIFFVLVVSQGVCFAQNIYVKNDVQNKKLIFGNRKISMALDYNAKAAITLLIINGQQVIESASGIYSEISTASANYSTLQLSGTPAAIVTNNSITLNSIIYGDKQCQIKETWRFTVTESDIKFDMDRTLSNAIIVNEAALPVFIFNNINTWEGAYQDYGGLAWFYLFNKKLDTYGVHSQSSKFWNSKTGNGLSIQVIAPGKEVAMKYSRTADDKLAYSIVVSQQEMLPRFDSSTNRRRYLRDRTDVWAPFESSTGKTTQSMLFSYFNFNDEYGRGKLEGINGNEVSAVLNTIARIGVIDKQHFGGNSWHTPYGPICLHEQYIAQLGLAINDNNYLKGYQQCLDYYRDNAIKPDGRVWARWAYSNEDMMPGEVTDRGFYEAQWGYLLDANPDLVTNVVELYNQTGNKAWIKTHQQSCEKALDWILKRDGNNNGLVEMITDSHTQKKGSDWIDIIWASYENAFVNAKLYHALQLWADVEKQLGNTAKANYYGSFAAKLKGSFNKPVAEGGFWNKEKECYIHWREKDGSAHGNNMVTPVNFMAIGYGICDDSVRTKIILDNIEKQMQQEQLFFWPICMSSYEPGDGNDWQFPFPNYENGDLFLSWGALGVNAYATYKPDLALKYVKNVLAQYAKDGLAFQRYGRVKQDGLGDDILSGNSLSVVGLYQAIYGINPMHNRFYLNPHITAELNGTIVKYKFRNQQLAINLNLDKYAVSNNQHKIIAQTNFGFFSNNKELSYFNKDDSTAALKVTTIANGNLTVNIKRWDAETRVWSQISTNKTAQKLVYQLNDLKPNTYYTVSINNSILQRIKSTNSGTIKFTYKSGNEESEIKIINK